MESHDEVVIGEMAKDLDKVVDDISRGRNFLNTSDEDPNELSIEGRIIAGIVNEL